MHKTEKRAKESRMNLMYSYLCDGTLDLRKRDLDALVKQKSSKCL